MNMNGPRVVELCAGGGGQAIGLEQAGFVPVVLIDNDKNACDTLRANRPSWHIVEGDLNTFDGRPYEGVELMAGGLPCPPFSVAGQQQGENDDRNLFPAALRLIDEIKPMSIMIENVPGLLMKRFDSYRLGILTKLKKLGYIGEWNRLNASDFGVPQYRPRAVLVAIRKDLHKDFNWPLPIKEEQSLTVGSALYDLMAARGWRHVDEWCSKASSIAPTIVGGSLKHGGPDLGPTRARRAWLDLSVDGSCIADFPPDPYFDGLPRLTVRMVARLQGFPDDWSFCGKKTPAYRQVGNAFPPPVALALATQIRACLGSNQLTLALA